MNIPDYGDECDSASYRQMYNLSTGLMNESASYKNISINQTSEEMRHRGQLASLELYGSVYPLMSRSYWTQPESVNRNLAAFLYGVDNIQHLMSVPWDDLEDRITQRIQEYMFSEGYGNIAFGGFDGESSNNLYAWDSSSGPCWYREPCIVGRLRNKVFTDGRRRANIKRATALKSDIMKELSDLTKTSARGYITPCAWRSIHDEEDACAGELCPPLLTIIGQNVNSTANCVRAAPNSDIVPVENCRDNLLPLARDALVVYEDCYQDNCGRSPWAPWESSIFDECDEECQWLIDESMHYSELAQEAMLIGDWDNGRIYANLSVNLSWQYGECFEDYGCEF